MADVGGTSLGSEEAHLDGKRAETTREEIISDMVQHIPNLRRYARALTHNVSFADDVVQTCLEVAITKIDKYEPGTNLCAWLMKIMHNRFIDSYRKKKKANGIAADLEQARYATISPPNQIDVLQVSELEAALAQLPANQRSTLLLVTLEQLTYGEVAKITGVPVGTVRSRLSRARRSMARMSEGEFKDEVRKEIGQCRSAEVSDLV